MNEAKTKHIYRDFMAAMERVPVKIEKLKTYVYEWIAIYKKELLYKNIRWTVSQKQEFDSYWKQVYGKRISPRWHKLYQATSGVYNKEYIPEILYTTKIEPALNNYQYSKVLSHKALIEYLCRDDSIVFPKTYIVRDNGIFYDGMRNVISNDNAIRIINSAKCDIVVKPTFGSSSGQNMLFISAQEHELIPQMIENFGKDYIAQEAIQPNPTFSKFNPSSINTIRITTYVTSNGIKHVPIAFRIGRKNKRVDNIHAGGIGVAVKDNGELYEKGYELGYGDSAKVYTEHPDTHIPFSKCVLPKIPEIIQAAHRLHGRFPHIGFISWDFTVNKEGNIVLIEANTKGQGVWFPQMISGCGLLGADTKEILNTIKLNG